jgi:hypothetical protein
LEAEEIPAKSAIEQARDAYHFMTICDEQVRVAKRGRIQLPPSGGNLRARRSLKRRR